MAALQFTHTGFRARVGPASIARLERDYRRRRYLLIPGFLDPALLHLLQDQIERTRFQIVKHRGFGRDLRVEQSNATASLNFLLNDRRLFRFVEQTTGCGRLGSLIGSVRRAVPKPGDALGWHNDNLGDRMVSITINLSSAQYQGGVLQIRSARSKKIVAEVSNTGPGNAVSADLEHHNTAVSGEIAKTAFSGWFLSKPDFEASFADTFRSRASSSAGGAIAESGGGDGSIGADTIFNVPTGIVLRQIGEDTLLLNVASGESFRLDSIGREMWNLLSRGNSIRAASRAIAAEYGVAVREVANDAKGLTGQLLAQGLLERHARSSLEVRREARAST